MAGHVVVDPFRREVLRLNVVPAMLVESFCTAVGTTAGVAEASGICRLIVSCIMVAVEASAVMMGVAEVLRDSMLVASVTLNNATVLRAAWVSGGLELLLDSAVLVLAIVVSIMGVLAVDPLAVSVTVVTVAVAVALVTVTRAKAWAV